jgi:hypothetical protein
MPSESGPADHTVFSRIYRLDRRIRLFDLPAILALPKKPDVALCPKGSKSGSRCHHASKQSNSARETGWMQDVTHAPRLVTCRELKLRWPTRSRKRGTNKSPKARSFNGNRLCLS